MVIAASMASLIADGRVDAQPCITQVAKLLGAGTVGQGQMGNSAALSADGNTAVIGAYQDNAATGAVFAFVRSGSVWTQQGSKLVPTGGVGPGGFGQSISLSGDGNTALIGAGNDNVGIGAAFVFVRSNGAWAQQSKLTPAGGVGAGVFGTTVCLSADGNTAIVGAYRDNTLAGAAYVFVRSGSVWIQQGPKLVVTAGGVFGFSVSLSADGNTALVGAIADSGYVGAAYVFTRSAGVWSQQGGKIIPIGAAGAAQFGASASLSSDASTALIGANTDNGSIGAAYVFTRSGTIWSQQGSKLVAAGGVGQANFGESVSLASNGNIAIVGARNDARVGGLATGAAYVFARSGSLWLQQGAKLVPTGSIGAAQYGLAFGASVALGANGVDAIMGDPGDSNSTGAAYIFAVNPSINFTQQPAPASIFPSTNAAFSVTVDSRLPLTYQWRRNGVNLANAPTGTGSVTTGVDTATLTISYASYADNGSAFDCVVSNACGSKQSNPSGLAVGPLCRADFNATGTLTVQDIFDFLNAWFAGCP